MTHADAVEGSRNHSRPLPALAAGLLLLSVAGCDSGQGNVAPVVTTFVPPTSNFCSATADSQLSSCQAEVTDDVFKARAICINVADAFERDACFGEAETARMDGTALCTAQRTAHGTLCTSVGEARYEPDFNPALFSTDFTNPRSVSNPYRLLNIGDHWEYQDGGTELVTIDVLNKTKLIDGVTCIVVRDVVEDDGELVEDTNDWFAQANNGDVYYCGEEVKDYEYFAGDTPQDPELVSIDGSFKQGRDGDKGGILFLGTPTVGAVYRQEFVPGNAEDAARVLSINYGPANSGATQFDPPAALVTLLCAANDCVVTREFSPLSPQPEADERKYFARDIGLFFSVHEVTGEGVQLTACNVDSRCAALPAP